MNQETTIVAAESTDPVLDTDGPPMYSGASMLVLDASEIAGLTADFDDNEVEIRPDGLIYLPQAFFRQRLNQVIGIGQWALVQHAVKMDEDHYVYFDGSLFIRGKFVARAMGEGQKHDNAIQSMAAVYESAKSDCIVRCCKDLSIASKLWQPEYARKWTDEHAVRVWRESGNGWSARGGKKGDFFWRRKDSPPFWWEGKSEKREKKSVVPAPEAASERSPRDIAGDYQFKKGGRMLRNIPDEQLRESLKSAKKSGDPKHDEFIRKAALWLDELPF